jgi:hypothetical protein
VLSSLVSHGSDTMITIRRDQISAFKDAALKAFEDETVYYIKEVLPDRFNSLGEADIRRIICLGVSRSALHNITLRLDVQRYIVLMLRLVPDFDDNPITWWAKSILVDTSIESEEKLDQVEAYAIITSSFREDT